LISNELRVQLYGFSVIRQFINEKSSMFFRMHDVAFAELMRFFNDNKSHFIGQAILDLINTSFACSPLGADDDEAS
jgi:hypothetical protein